MTLIDSLDMLAILGNKTEFSRMTSWVCRAIDFNKDIRFVPAIGASVFFQGDLTNPSDNVHRVHIFEVNIRLLGGLLSAHVLATDKVL